MANLPQHDPSSLAVLPSAQRYSHPLLACLCADGALTRPGHSATLGKIPIIKNHSNQSCLVKWPSETLTRGDDATAGGLGRWKKKWLAKVPCSHISTRSVYIWNDFQQTKVQINCQLWCAILGLSLFLTTLTKSIFYSFVYLLIFVVSKARMRFPQCLKSNPHRNRRLCDGWISSSPLSLGLPLSLSLSHTLLLALSLSPSAAGGVEKRPHGRGLLDHQRGEVGGHRLLRPVHRDRHQRHGVSQQWHRFPFSLLRWAAPCGSYSHSYWFMNYVTIFRRIIFMCSSRSIYSMLNVSASLVTVGLSWRLWCIGCVLHLNSVRDRLSPPAPRPSQPANVELQNDSWCARLVIQGKLSIRVGGARLAAHANVANRLFILPHLFPSLPLCPLTFSTPTPFPWLLLPPLNWPLRICISPLPSPVLSDPSVPFSPRPPLMSLVSSRPFTSSRPFLLYAVASLSPPCPLPPPNPLSSPSVSLLQSPSVPMCGWWCSWCCCWCQQ